MNLLKLIDPAIKVVSFFNPKVEFSDPSKTSTASFYLMCLKISIVPISAVLIALTFKDGNLAIKAIELLTGILN